PDPDARDNEAVDRHSGRQPLRCRGESGPLALGRHRQGAGELSPAGAAAGFRYGSAGGSPGRLAVPGLQESAGAHGKLREVLRLRLLAVLVAARGSSSERRVVCQEPISLSNSTYSLRGVWRVVSTG